MEVAKTLRMKLSRVDLHMWIGFKIWTMDEKQQRERQTQVSCNFLFLIRNDSAVNSAVS